jgi:hypothetical protein
MTPRYRFIALAVLSMLISISARAQDSSRERQSQQQQQAIGADNPLMPARTQVAFSGSGAADFVPHNFNGSLPGPTPAPNCTPKLTQVGFQIQCMNDPENKSASTCRGTLSFYAFNETRNVSGEVMTQASDSYSMKLSSADGDIVDCELRNLAPVSGSLGNVISMSGCGLNIAGCGGEAVGAGANQAVTSSGSVILTPSE